MGLVLDWLGSSRSVKMWVRHSQWSAAKWPDVIKGLVPVANAKHVYNTTIRMLLP